MDTIIFWQNIISPHQLDFLRAMSEYYHITLIVDEVQDKYRKKDGWEIPDHAHLTLVVAPKREELPNYFKQPETYHIFSGISAYSIVFAGFQNAVHHRARIGILSEPLNLTGVKGIFRLLKGKLEHLKYKKHIDFIAATGQLGIVTYRTFGYPLKNIFQWGYFVDAPHDIPYRRKKEIIFVGNLNRNKQILTLLKVFLKGNSGFNRIHIIGSGPLESELRNYENEQVKLYGRRPSSEVTEKISQCSLLVLPSLNEGWGVVVNEALLCGTPVLASSAVGASILLDGEKRGSIFNAGDMVGLERQLQHWSTKEFTEEDYKQIRSWAEATITPKVAATYFNEILAYTCSKRNERPKAPWIKKA